MLKEISDIYEFPCGDKYVLLVPRNRALTAEENDVLASVNMLSKILYGHRLSTLNSIRLTPYVKDIFMISECDNTNDEILFSEKYKADDDEKAKLIETVDLNKKISFEEYPEGEDIVISLDNYVKSVDNGFYVNDVVYDAIFYNGENLLRGGKFHMTTRRVVNISGMKNHQDMKITLADNTIKISHGFINGDLELIGKISIRKKEGDANSDYRITKPESNDANKIVRYFNISKNIGDYGNIAAYMLHMNNILRRNIFHEAIAEVVNYPSKTHFYYKRNKNITEDLIACIIRDKILKEAATFDIEIHYIDNNIAVFCNAEHHMLKQFTRELPSFIRETEIDKIVYINHKLDGDRIYVYGNSSLTGNARLLLEVILNKYSYVDAGFDGTYRKVGDDTVDFKALWKDLSKNLGAMHNKKYDDIDQKYKSQTLVFDKHKVDWVWLR